jgi:hypothetical protein
MGDRGIKGEPGERQAEDLFTARRFLKYF